ncbi:MAG: hypothetical protein AAFN77_16070 [Planctomycetota bacterium]
MNLKNTSLALLALVFLVGAIMPAGVLNADTNGGYTIGPLRAIGSGANPIAARQDAYGELLNMVFAIENNLGPGESLGGFSITYELWAPGDGTYTIDFEVYIDENGPPGM